ncbi:hypothetical protein KCTCHS21_03060 [Cohnella abietis]|uniref:Uncharacterized protein n=1 Tax=Cohnella abietis TaxID=2507935 RepID=A0A3T1CYG7_9BACL|nr:hypothetical protein KCTCHS21_03060 [Cohnella abietis]
MLTSLKSMLLPHKALSSVPATKQTLYKGAMPSHSNCDGIAPFAIEKPFVYTTSILRQDVGLHFVTKAITY